MAVAHYTASGVLRGIVSTTPQGHLRRWNLDNAESLIYSAVQLVTYTGELDKATGRRKSSPHHTVLKNVQRMVWDALSSRGVLPEVDIIATEAVITSRGNVVTEHGYDPRARTLLAIPERDRAAWSAMRVHETPTREDAQEALDWLIAEITVDFPFDTPGDLARFMAYLLTCSGRAILDMSPAFGSSGAEVASGKTMLLEIGRVVANGHARYATWKGGRLNEAEDVKALVSALGSANGDTVFDSNDEASASSTTSTGKIESLMITSAVTSTDGSRTERVLQKSDSIPIAECIFTAAGNGIVWGADLMRRNLTWKLLLKTGERAIERNKFRHSNMIDWTTTNRVQILERLYTILAHGIRNPAVVPGYGLGSFSKIVIAALDHLTIDGQNAHLLTMDQLQTSMSTDDVSEDWGQTMSALSRLAGGRAFEAAHARIWMATEEIEAPAKIRNSRATRETALSKAWSTQLGWILDRNVSHGDYRFKLKLVESRPGYAKKFHIERWGRVGEEMRLVPETPVTGDLPVDPPADSFAAMLSNLTPPAEEN